MRKIKNILMKFVFYKGLIAFLSLLVLNIIISNTLINNKIDLTNDKLYTLSSNTINVIKNLNEQIKVQFFFSKSLSQDIPQVKDFERRIRELLISYAKLSKNIDLEIIDPKPFTDLEDLASSYGVQGLQLNQEGEMFYLGAVLSNSVNDITVIPFFEITRERYLEYDLTKSIHNLSKREKPLIGLVSGLPFAGGLSNSLEPAFQNPFYLHQNISEFFDIKDISTTIDNIPDEVDQLLIIYPKSLSETQLYAIDQFVLSGKGVTFFIDPLSEHEIVNSTSIQENPELFNSNLNKLFKAWGFEVQTNMVVGDFTNGRKVSLGNQNNEKIVTYIPWIALEGDLLSRNDIITANLDYLFFKSAGSIKNLSTNNELEFIPLVKTSQNSMLIEKAKLQFKADPEALLKNFKSENKSFILGARITGNFKSAFSEKELSELGIKKEIHVKKNSNSNILVFADTDLLTDITWLTQQNILGRRNIIAIADNGRLVMNSLESMSGGKNLIGLRGRGVSNRPFLLIENLQKNAEIMLKEKEDALKEELAETENKLQKIQDENITDKENLSLEQTETINKFNKKIINIRKDLREVQRKLGENIRSLETKLKIINIWLIPSLIVVVYYILKIAIRKRRDSVNFFK